MYSYTPFSLKEQVFMYNSPVFNAQAVLFFSAADYAVTCEVAPNLELELHTERQANGNYTVYPTGTVGAIAAADAILQAQGLDKLRRRTQVSHQSAMATMAALRARVSLDSKDGPEYKEFLQAQLDSYASPNPAPEFVKAREDFLHTATILLTELQPFFPEYTIRKLVNPLTSLALAKQRTGVFVWPDWRSDRYVNLIVSHAWPGDHDLREAIYDWADRIGVRINFGVHF